jgi:hypothetical protein
MWNLSDEVPHVEADTCRSAFYTHDVFQHARHRGVALFQEDLSMANIDQAACAPLASK